MKLGLISLSLLYWYDGLIANHYLIHLIAMKSMDTQRNTIRLQHNNENLGLKVNRANCGYEAESTIGPLSPWDSVEGELARKAWSRGHLWLCI